MAFENLPGIFPTLIDGNLSVAAVNTNPVVLVLGTASRGVSENLYTVNSVTTAAKLFGRTDGTLVRGLYEVSSGGAENIRLFRIGAKPAVLASVGTGLTITTVDKDAGAGTDVKIFFDDTAGRLRVWRVSDDLLVYDNNPAYPSAAIDLQVVSVTGTWTTGAGNIGLLAAPITLAAAHSVSGAVYTAGSDGILLSRMELFENLYTAYKLLENEDIDIVVPMNAFIDDLNTQDMTTAEVSTFNSGAPWAADANTYPEPGSKYDGLGKVFVQEYEGQYYFWWDLDRDGVAEIWPAGIGFATKELDANAVALTLDDFHEANFAYQLADFCYSQSENNAEMIGVIGTLPPNSWSLKDISNWIGKAPVSAEDTNGNQIITTDGTGLLGVKWVAGRLGASGKPGHTINNLAGLLYGGFPATDNHWLEGEHLLDQNDRMVDLGKYISIVPSVPILSNPTSTTAYAASGAGVYAGFISSLPPNSAPTNKVQPGIRLPFRVAVSKLDELAGFGYVMFQDKPKGIVVADAPTASRPDSDYRRLTTIRIVKATIDGVRSAAEPFLGESITGTSLAALETSIQQVLAKLQKNGYITRYNMALSSTPSERVQGKATVELILVPAFELRQISVTIALAAQ